MGRCAIPVGTPPPQPVRIRPPVSVNRGLRARLCGLFLIFFVVAAAWALVVTWTGGFAVNLGPFRLRSRSPWKPMIVATLLGVLTAVLAKPGHRRQSVAAEFDLILRGLA